MSNRSSFSGVFLLTFEKGHSCSIMADSEALLREMYGIGFSSAEVYIITLLLCSVHCTVGGMMPQCLSISSGRKVIAFDVGS